MTAPRIRADYDRLAEVAQVFGDQAKTVQQALRNVRREVETLQSGDWVGHGANAFYGEIDQTVFPTLTRLANALDSARTITLQISQTMATAEAEAAAVFSLNGSASVHQKTGAAGVPMAGPDAASGPPPAMAPKTAAGGGGLEGVIDWSKYPETGAIEQATLGPPPLSKNPSQKFVVRDPQLVFSEKYYDSLVRSQIQGRNSKVLNGVMERLLENPPEAERERLLMTMSRIRGRPLPELRAEFARFQQIRRVQRRKPDALDYKSQWLDFSDHPDFLGSTTSLRYGKVVGDIFGIDPVFGALLNPTGGIMGPGSSGLPQPGPDRPLAFHSILHDAGGYLLNTHGVGPGYDYLRRERAYDPADKLTGQKSGMRYWHNRMNSPGPDWLTENAAEAAMDAYIWKEDGRRPRRR